VLDELRMGRESAMVAELALRRLAARKIEILRALAGCETTGETADELRISPLTVQSHVKSIPAKLRLHSRTESLTFAPATSSSPSWSHAPAEIFDWADASERYHARTA